MGRGPKLSWATRYRYEYILGMPPWRYPRGVSIPQGYDFSQGLTNKQADMNMRIGVGHTASLPNLAGPKKIM